MIADSNPSPNSNPSRFNRSSQNSHSLLVLPTFEIETKYSNTPKGTAIPEDFGVATMEVGGELTRRDIFYRGSLIKLGLPTSATSHHWRSCPDMSPTPPSGRSRPLVETARVANGLPFWRCRWSGVFAYFCLSNVLLYAAYDVLYLYAPDYWMSVNLSVGASDSCSTNCTMPSRHLLEGQAASLISYIGFSSTFGQVRVQTLANHNTTS